MQRFDSEPIPGQKQGFGIAVPQSKSKHAAEAGHALLTPGFPCMHDHFRVAARVEAMAQCLQLRYQLLIVVDLAIEDDGNASVFVEQRLLPRCNVDNRQPAVPQCDTRLVVLALSVGATMRLRVVHASQQTTIELAPATRIEYACNTAHCYQHAPV